MPEESSYSSMTNVCPGFWPSALLFQFCDLNLPPPPERNRKPKQEMSYLFCLLWWFSIRLQKLAVFSRQLLDQLNPSDVISSLKLAQHPCLKGGRKSKQILKSTIPGHDTTTNFNLKRNASVFSYLWYFGAVCWRKMSRCFRGNNWRGAEAHPNLQMYLLWRNEGRAN